jgi:putative peptidoglycan lipid II flippase
LILLVAKDGVSLVFERGAFNSNAVLMVTEALCFLSFSILPYVFRDSITRIYYAFNDSKTPFVIALYAIVLKVFLNWLLILKLNMGIAGITLSTSFVTLFNATILGMLIHKKIKLDFGILFFNFGKMLVSGFLTFFVCLFACKYFDTLNFSKYMFESLKIAGIMILCLLTYSGLNIMFRMEYAGELLNRIRRK